MSIVTSKKLKKRLSVKKTDLCPAGEGGYVIIMKTLRRKLEILSKLWYFISSVGSSEWVVELSCF